MKSRRALEGLRLRRGLLCAGLILGMSAGLSPRQVRITAMDLRDFPQVKLVISLTTALGQATPAPVNAVRIEENGMPVAGAEVTPLDTEQWPVYAVVAIDRSGSMQGEPLREARNAVRVYAETMAARDRTALVSFDTRIQQVLDFSAQAGEIISAMTGIQPGRNTAFLDALMQAIGALETTPPGVVRLLLALTDGKDNRSRCNEADVTAKARAAGVLLCLVGLGPDADMARLLRLAAAGGGLALHAPSPVELTGLFRRVAQMVHVQWGVAYRSPHELDNTWRKIMVAVPRGETEWIGERMYLAAEHAVMARSGLKAVRRGQRLQARQAAQRHPSEGSTVLVLGLSILLALLAVALAVVLVKRGRR